MPPQIDRCISRYNHSRCDHWHSSSICRSACSSPRSNKYSSNNQCRSNSQCRSNKQPPCTSACACAFAAMRTADARAADGSADAAPFIGHGCLHTWPHTLHSRNRWFPSRHAHCLSCRHPRRPHFSSFNKPRRARRQMGLRPLAPNATAPSAQCAPHPQLSMRFVAFLNRSLFPDGASSYSFM